MTTETKKRRLISNVSVMGGGMDIAALRQLAKNEPKAFIRKVEDLTAKGDLRLDMIQDWRALYTAIADVSVPTTMPDAAGNQRAMTASAFPLLTGTLAISAINDAYNSVPTIGEQLVQEIDDPKKSTVIANIHSLDKDIAQVGETEDFPEIGAEEDSVTIGHKKNGRVVRISAEAIRENEVANIAQKFNALGEIAGDWVEEQTLERVCDKYGSNTSAAAAPYVYNPKGVGAALFSSTANTPGTRAPSGTRVNSNALADYTDLDAVYTVLAAMKNSRGKRIGVRDSELVLMVPHALKGTVTRTLNSVMVPGTVNEHNTWGPEGMYRPKLVCSPKIDDISTTAWYMGTPQRQFKRKWKMRFEYVTLGENTQAYLNAQIAFQARVAWDVEIGATDYVYWVQSLSSTTYTP